MGVLTYTDEHTSPVIPTRIFKASIVDSHNLMPKLLPDAIKSITLIKGDGGVGSIKQINFAGGFAKHQIDEIDEKSLTYKYTLIEGNGISDKIEKVSYDIKFESSPDGGSISKMTTTIYTRGDFEIKEDELKAGKEKVLGLYKVVEAYLINNPDAYSVIFIQRFIKQAAILDSHNLMPKLLPEAIKSIELIKGDGGAGSIKQINFAGGFAKHQIDEIDEKTLTYKYTLIEGNGISDKIEKVSYDIKFESSSEGGTVSNMTTTIYTRGDIEIKEEELKAGKEKVLGLYKVAEAYLINNPDAYI
ncbi:hypothetical protein M8C21_026684 [Ambrosia artemisiifolia]|uniref:Bet v I/Major latex protein domain-containing protein n=1 Tax=Ambrosia artemisiifolia TaxID=4212 RepID=A0AAD5D5X6_AMBAR|nr:hypothetical protein M8C21_026684 [Ambrosia artemisiifolia]